MNKRILKIDADAAWSHDRKPKCSVRLHGVDHDDDMLSIELDGEDAREFLRLAQAIAGQESRTVDGLIDALNERRTLPHSGYDMTIDSTKTYRTRDGRAVRIYAVDGVGRQGYRRAVHGAIWDDGLGGWIFNSWNHCGSCENPNLNLVEATLADELREQIPWSALRPGIQWVAMDGDGKWCAFRGQNKPHPREPSGKLWAGKGHRSIGDAISMPKVDPARWCETLVERPEGR